MPGGPVCPDCSGRLSPDRRSCPFCERSLATRLCGGCGVRNLVVAEACSACGEALSTQSVEDLLGATCPVCGQLLSVHESHGVRIHDCGACGGVFLDEESFELATEDGEVRAGLHFRESVSPYRGSVASPDEPPATPPPEAGFYRRCPACRTVMNRVNFGRRSGVLLDVCRRHGTWFDRDELLRVLSFVERGGLEEARRREREELEAEKVRSRETAAAVRVALAGEPLTRFWGRGQALSELGGLLAALFGRRGRR